jgi:hypothetical protein
MMEINHGGTESTENFDFVFFMDKLCVLCVSVVHK